MELEQALKVAAEADTGTLNPRMRPIECLETITTLAAEVRRLQGDLSPVILDRIRDMGYSAVVDDATVSVHAWQAARAARSKA